MYFNDYDFFYYCFIFIFFKRKELSICIVYAHIVVVVGRSTSSSTWLTTYLFHSAMWSSTFFSHFVYAPVSKIGNLYIEKYGNLFLSTTESCKKISKQYLMKSKWCHRSLGHSGQNLRQSSSVLVFMGAMKNEQQQETKSYLDFTPDTCIMCK